MVLIIDPLRGLSDGLGKAEQKLLSHKIQILCSVTKKLAVPAAVSILGDTPDMVWPEALANQHTIPVYLRSTANPWDDPALRGAMEKHRPAYLVMLGFWGEISLTMGAFSAHRAGHDVYLLIDCCPGSEAPLVEGQIDRMMKSGMNPMTWKQLIFEWARYHPPLLDDQLLADLLNDEDGASELFTALQVQD